MTIQIFVCEEKRIRSASQEDVPALESSIRDIGRRADLGEKRAGFIGRMDNGAS